MSRITLQQWVWALSRDIDKPMREMVRGAHALMSGEQLPTQSTRGRKTKQGRDFWLAAHYELHRALGASAREALDDVSEHWGVHVESVRLARRRWGPSVASQQ